MQLSPASLNDQLTKVRNDISKQGEVLAICLCLVALTIVSTFLNYIPLWLCAGGLIIWITGAFISTLKLIQLRKQREDLEQQVVKTPKLFAEYPSSWHWHSPL